MSFMRLRMFTITTAPIPIFARFCWKRRLWSAEKITVKPRSTAARSRTPFRRPLSFSRRAIEHSNSGKKGSICYGMDWSMSSRNGRYRLSCNLKGCNGLISRDRRKGLEELLDRVASLQVVEQALGRHTCANENRRSTHDLRGGMNNFWTGNVERHFTF